LQYITALHASQPLSFAWGKGEGQGVRFSGRIDAVSAI
jgi:hypothetical protein